MRKICFTLVFCFILFYPSSICMALDFGDVNFDSRTDIVDALMIARYSVGLISEVDEDFLVKGDVNQDAFVTIVDALIIAQFYVGLYDSLPLGTSLPENTLSPSPARPSTSVTPDPFPVDNPFKEAVWYVNPIWSQKAKETGGEAIANCHTAIWMDSIGAITDGLGLRGHLDGAVAQEANLVTVVISGIPNRSCANLPQIAIPIWNKLSKDYNRYTKEFIDPISAIFSDPAYKNLRIVTIIEPDTLANLATNLNIADCLEAAGKDGYRDCIVYALNSFGEIPNVYNYLSMGYSAWLGWDSNLKEAVPLYSNTIKRTKKGLKSVEGLAVNVAKYNPVEEPFLTNSQLKIGKKKVVSAVFYEWNHCLDEMDYIQRLHGLFRSQGFSEDLSFVIDTSLNGWGGPHRPTQVSQSLDLETYVNESRIDKRAHRGNDCNIRGAGLGYRPQAEPAPLVHAYLWIWPPGESLGVSTPHFEQDPDDPALHYERRCDPLYKGVYIQNPQAMGPAPHYGRWFPDYFKMLLKNAYPPVE